LKQVSPQPDHVAVSDYAGAHRIRYWIFGNHATALQPVFQLGMVPLDGDGAPGKFVDDAAFLKDRGRAHGAAHGGLLEGGGFGGMAAGAGLLGVGEAEEEKCAAADCQRLLKNPSSTDSLTVAVR
jgi:hypothetical protein